MSIAIAIPAIGTLLQVGNGASPEVFNSVANIGDITGPSVAAAVVDVTSHTAVSAPWRQKITTLLDPGTITFPIYFVPSSGAATGAGTFVGHNFQGGSGGPTQGIGGLGRLFTNRGLSPGVPYNWKIIFPDGVPTTYEFQAWISKMNLDAKVAGVLMGSIQLDLTGVPSFS